MHPLPRTGVARGLVRGRRRGAPRDVRAPALKEGRKKEEGMRKSGRRKKEEVKEK